MVLKDMTGQLRPVKIIGDIYNTEISALTLDSRKCTPGCLYFAIPGTQVDGHDFIAAAVAAGAAAVVAERETPCGVPQIIVEDARSAMSFMAAAFYGYPAKKLKLIGFTGTNGKTTTTYMLRAIAEYCGISAGVIGTAGSYLNGQKLDIKIATSTTPDPIELQYILKKLAEGGAQWVIMEVTAHALDLRKVDGLLFDAAVFTNLTQDHLDYFGDMEHYYLAKAAFFTKERAKGAVINVDDPYGLRLSQETELPVLACGMGENSAFIASEITYYADRSAYTLAYGKDRLEVLVPSPGAFNVYNSLCVLGAALLCGVERSRAVEGLKSFRSVPGRFETPDMAGRDFSVVIDYAHTPDGLENILKAVYGYKKGRLLCVFGCGGNRDPLKRPIMGEIATRLCDYTVLTSDNPRFEEPEAIIDQIEAGVPPERREYSRNADRTQAIRAALEMAREGDVIVIAGKGDEDYQEIKGVKHHFSDREAVEKLLKEIDI